MDMRNDSQSPCSNRYQRGMEQRERNRKRRRNARLKRILKEAAVCISVAALTAGGAPVHNLKRSIRSSGNSHRKNLLERTAVHPGGYESMMSEREAYLQQEGIQE